MRGLFVSARALYLPGAWMPYALGVVLARGPADARAVAVGAIVVTLVHVITHWVNDAEDVATDDRTAAPTAFTGGSRAIQRGLVTPRALLRASLALAAVVLLVAAGEALAGHLAAAALHVAILVLGYAYSGAPFALGRRGLGEVDTALVMGVLVPLAGAAAAGGATPAVHAAAAVLFAQTIVARLSTAWPDLDADRDTGKRTLVVLLGARASGVAFGAAAAAAATLGVLGAPHLPHPAAQRAIAGGFALVAAGIGALVASGRAARRPIVVPILGSMAWGTSLAAVLAASVLR